MRKNQKENRKKNIIDIWRSPNLNEFISILFNMELNHLGSITSNVVIYPKIILITLLKHLNDFTKKISQSK